MGEAPPRAKMWPPPHPDPAVLWLLAFSRVSPVPAAGRTSRHGQTSLPSSAPARCWSATLHLSSSSTFLSFSLPAQDGSKAPANSNPAVVLGEPAPTVHSPGPLTGCRDRHRRSVPAEWRLCVCKPVRVCTGGGDRDPAG